MIFDGFDVLVLKKTKKKHHFNVFLIKKYYVKILCIILPNTSKLYLKNRLFVHVNIKPNILNKCLSFMSFHLSYNQ